MLESACMPPSLMGLLRCQFLESQLLCLAQNLANLWYLASAVLVSWDGIRRRTLVEDFTHEGNKCHLLRWPRRLQWDRDGRCWWHSAALSSFWPKHQLGCFDLRSASIAIQASQIPINVFSFVAYVQLLPYEAYRVSGPRCDARGACSCTLTLVFPAASRRRTPVTCTAAKLPKS